MSSDKVTFEAIAEVSNMVREFKKVEDVQDRVEAKTKTGKKHADAWGGSMKSMAASGVVSMVKWAGGIATVTTVIKGATAALALQRSEQEKLVAAQRDGIDSRTKLAQIADSPEQLASFIKRAENLREKTGTDKTSAFDAVFAAVSTGHAEDTEVDEVALKGIKIAINPEKLINTVSQLQKIYGENNISIAEAVNMLLIGAKDSVKNVDEFAGAAGQLFLPFQRIGGTASEAMGWASQIAGLNPDKTATVIEQGKTLSNELANKRANIKDGGELTGLELVDNLARLEKEGKIQDDKGQKTTIDKLLGDVAYVGYLGYLANKESASQSTANIARAKATTGTADDVLDRQVMVGASDSVVTAARHTEIEKARNDKALYGRIGGAAELSKAITTSRETAMLEDGSNLVSRTLSSSLIGLSRAILPAQKTNLTALREEAHYGNIGTGGYMSADLEKSVAQDLLANLVNMTPETNQFLEKIAGQSQEGGAGQAAGVARRDAAAQQVGDVTRQNRNSGVE